jgi:hypothetical protein
MVVEGYTGPLSFMFFITEIGHGKGGTGGTVAVPVNPDADDTHIPFNPVKSTKFTAPIWKQIKEILMGEIIESTFTPGDMEDGKQSITDAIYHAPFLMAKIFPKKEIGVWGADLTAKIAMSAALDDFVLTPETLATHFHLDDKAGTPHDIDINLFGGMLEEYSWSFKVGDVLRENAEIRYTNIKTGAIAYNSAPTFQNQRYALWNDLWISDSKVVGIPFTALTISTYANMDAAIRVIGGKFTIKMPRKTGNYLNSSATSGLAESSHRTHLEVEFELDVEVIDDEAYTESLAQWKSRTDATCKVMWTSGAFSEYLQCTKMVLDPDGEYEIPEVKDSPLFATKLKFMPKSDAVLTFAGAYDQSESPDPILYINAPAR